MEPFGPLRPMSAALGASPPPEALIAVADAAGRAKQLARADRQLHFELDQRTGRVVVELRTLDGELVGRLTGARALAVLTDPER